MSVMSVEEEGEEKRMYSQSSREFSNLTSAQIGLTLLIRLLVFALKFDTPYRDTRWFLLTICVPEPIHSTYPSGNLDDDLIQIRSTEYFNIQILLGLRSTRRALEEHLCTIKEYISVCRTCQLYKITDEEKKTNHTKIHFNFYTQHLI